MISTEPERLGLEVILGHKLVLGLRAFSDFVSDTEKGVNRRLDDVDVLLGCTVKFWKEVNGTGNYLEL